MKITKVLGAVLGVLMVAALFTGAVAAHDGSDTMSKGEVYFYALYDDNAFENFTLSDRNNKENWMNADGNKISFVQDIETGKYYINGGKNAGDVSEGVYSKSIGEKTYTINVMYPTATVSGAIYNKDQYTGVWSAIADAIDGIITNKQGVDFNVSQTISDGVKVAGLMFISPDGMRTVNISGDGVKPTGDSFNLSYRDIKGMDLGEWKVQAYFEKGSMNGFTSLAPDYMYGQTYTFTIVNEDATKDITASVEEVTQRGYVTMTVTAPYGDWWISVDVEGVIPLKQPGVLDANLTGPNSEGTLFVPIHVDTSGEATFVVRSNSSNDMKVTLYKDALNRSMPNALQVKDLTTKKAVTIKVKAGAITAIPEKDSVYIGEDFKISGTNDLGGTLYFYVRGTNYDMVRYTDKKGGEETASGKIWDFTFDTSSLLKRPDAGTYTIYIAKLVNEDNKDYIATESAKNGNTKLFDQSEYVDSYTTVSVGFVQPFITATPDKDIVVQSGKLKITGNAEGNPTNVKIYVFGTNKFLTAEATVAEDGTYEFTKKIVAPGDGSINTNDNWELAAGQYFVVVQHKMYDKHYNIGPILNDDGGYSIVLNENGEFDEAASANITNETGWGYKGKVISNIASRQRANAAEALIQAIGSQNIDDMQAHFSFIVAGPTSVVNAIPSQVTKGQALTVSGTTTGRENEMVAVELLSTAFAAVPKETVGSASFTTLTTRIGDDGVWSVTFDTSNMNADDYTVSVAVGQLDAVTAKTKIVDGAAPTQQPTGAPTQQPTIAPTQQTSTVAPTSTPANPGFGALAALIGLGAVAVLLLRRE